MIVPFISESVTFSARKLGHLVHRSIRQLVIAALICITAQFYLSAEQKHALPTVANVAAQKIQAGEFESACGIVQKALQQTPKDVELWNLLGIAETELHRPTAAQDAFQHGLQLAPNSVSLNENIGFLFYRQGNYTSAKKYLGRAVSLGSQKSGVLFSLAASRLRTGEREKALFELKSLERSLASFSNYWVERGTAELPHDMAAAETSFARALDLAPASVPALNGAAYVAEAQDLDEKALSFLIKARKANPNDVPTLMHFANVCLRRDLGPDAVEALEKARSLDPSNNSALYLLARANIAVENWQTSYDLFKTFAQLVPNFAPTYYAMGWIDIKLNRIDDARQQLKRSLALDPNLSDARYELAQLDLNDGQLDSAERLLRTVLEQNPRHAKANMAMGDLTFRRGNLAAAKNFLETAIHEDPKLAAAHYKLAMLFFRKHEMQQGDNEKALAASLNAQAREAGKTQLRLSMPQSNPVQ
jgi:tetratricopeptide (TPR) repeat protein